MEPRIVLKFGTWEVWQLQCAEQAGSACHHDELTRESLDALSGRFHNLEEFFKVGRTALMIVCRRILSATANR